MHSLLLFTLLAAGPGDWWSRYNDPTLTRLVEATLSSNVDLATATARIAEARALTGGPKSKLLPEINALTSAQRLRGGFAQNIIRIPNPSGAQQSGAFVAPFETGLLQGGLDMRWELDFYGGNRAALKAAEADLLATQLTRDDLAITLSAETARYYFQLRGVEDRLEITRRNLDSQRELLKLTEDRANAGLATSLDIERQRALLANTEASVPALEAELAIARHRLAVLAGSENLPALDAAASLNAPSLNAALPSELLKRRPDVRAAEARLAAAQDRLKQARTDLYPKVTLNGLVGRQGTSLTTLSLGGGNFFNLGPQLQLPIFNGQRIRSNINANEARLEQARLAWRAEILAAFEEAANALASLEQQQQREKHLAAATAAARNSLNLAGQLQQAGLEDFLTVLDAQRSVWDAEFQTSAARTQVLVESAALFKALAGGWPE
jgi:NodT family efflux transporter outer membrane factor (OMF) lipoprotein